MAAGTWHACAFADGARIYEPAWWLTDMKLCTE
jgi:hypothetical protein